jgi:hypothetical protein
MDDVRNGSPPSPDGPPAGVLILGMHRSGTSAVTRLVNLLGPSMCVDEDLLVGTATNAKGHWESRSLFRLNDRYLGEMGCSWWYPPTSEQVADWEEHLPGAQFDNARTVFTRAHPTEPWVWKDPRACLTLSFWRRSLLRSVSGIVVFRSPDAVARSLGARDHMDAEYGLALWMRYTRLVLEQSAGLPLLVTSYDDVLEDPVAFAEQARAFLAGLGMAVTPDIDLSAVREFIDPGLRHGARNEAGPGATSDLYDTLRGLSGVHTSFVPPALGPEAPWIDAQLTSAGPEWRATWKAQGRPDRSAATRLRALVRRASTIGR